MMDNAREALRFDEIAGIFYQDNQFTAERLRDNASALFINKDNPCYRLLLAEGCNLTSHDESRSYASTARGLSTLMQILSVEFLYENVHEKTVKIAALTTLL